MIFESTSTDSDIFAWKILSIANSYRADQN